MGKEEKGWADQGTPTTTTKKEGGASRTRNANEQNEKSKHIEKQNITRSLLRFFSSQFSYSFSLHRLTFFILVGCYLNR